MEVKKVVKLLQDALSELHNETAYHRLVDITEKLFYETDARVVLVMNKTEFANLKGYMNWIEDGDLIRDVCCPHGVIDYVIIDYRVKQMYGYKMNAKK